MCSRGSWGGLILARGEKESLWVEKRLSTIAPFPPFDPMSKPVSLGFSRNRTYDLSGARADSLDVAQINAKSFAASKRLDVPIVEINPDELDTIRPAEWEHNGSIIFNIYDSQMYVVTTVNNVRRWTAADARSRYEALKARWNTIRLRRALAMRAPPRQGHTIDELLTTSWAQGIVQYEITNEGDDVQAIARWFRQKDGIEFEHELSTQDGIMPNGAVFVSSVQNAQAPFRLEPQAPIRPQIDGTGRITNWFTGPFLPYLTWNEHTLGPRLDSEGEEAFYATINTSPDVVDPQFNVRTQSNSQSDTLFLQQTFGTSSNFMVTVNGFENAVFDPHGLIATMGISPRIQEDGDPLLDVGTVDYDGFTANAGALLTTQGRIFFTPDIDPTPSDEPASVATDIYSLWRDPMSQTTDRVLIQLPSTVIQVGSVVGTELFNNFPHAVHPVPDLRTYNRPTTTNRVPYINYCKVRITVANYRFFRMPFSPNSSIWYFWNPGKSLWLFGVRSGNINNMYTINTDPITEERFLAGLGVGHILHRAQYEPIPNINPYSLFNGTPHLSTQIVGSLIVDEGVPILADRVNGGALICAFHGNTNPQSSDFIRFTQIAGRTNQGWRGTSPFVVRANTGSFDSEDFLQYNYAPSTFQISSQTFTRNEADNTIYSPSNPPNPGLFTYGSFTFGEIDVDERLNILFPPSWYITVSQGMSPDVAAVIARVQAIESDLNNFVGPVLQGVIDSIDQIGLTAELISARIIRVEQGIRLRIDQLAEAITAVASALNNFISAQNFSITDQLTSLGGGLGGGSGGEAFAAFIISNGPTLLSTVGGLLGVSAFGPITTGFTIALGEVNARFRTLLIQDGVVRYLTQAIALAEAGDIPGVVSNGALGIIAFNEFMRATTIDPIGGTVTIDDSIIQQGLDITGMLPQQTEDMVMELDENTEERGMIVGTTENIEHLTELADSLLIEINILGTRLGIPPVNPNDPNCY
jgi:hypothetical protein